MLEFEEFWKEYPMSYTQNEALDAQTDEGVS